MDASDRRKRAGAEAADWFARLEAGAMDRAEREQFVEWLQESQVHVAEMLRIAQIHGSLERFQRWTRIATGPKTDADNVLQLRSSQEAYSTSRPSPAATGMRHRLRFSAVAAMLVLLIGAAVILPRVRGEVIETDRGERREVVLADGSQLQVDPETRLRVKYSHEVRRVFLESGRALFHVAKNPDRPFLVQVDATTVRAVGTAFGVEQGSRGVIVTVAEGKVAVFATLPGAPPAPATAGQVPGSGASDRPDARSNNSSDRSDSHGHEAREGGTSGTPGTLFLTANQQVTVQSGGSAEPVREVDSQRALAWAEGRLIFQNDELGQVIAQFNRYNRVQLRVADPELASKPVSGVFNAAEPETFIAFLQSVAPVEIVRDGDRTITIGSSRAR